ncbi:hypothetical protein ACA910_012163 [Epithemia clementina (nom. ined.)]
MIWLPCFVRSALLTFYLPRATLGWLRDGFLLDSSWRKGQRHRPHVSSTTVSFSRQQHNHHRLHHHWTVCALNKNVDAAMIANHHDKWQKVQILPIQVNLTNVSVEYPTASWTQTLFSAMPRLRSAALSNVTLVLGGEPPPPPPPRQLVLVTGDSTAGKSTLLQVLAHGLESPLFAQTYGTMTLSSLSSSLSSSHESRPTPAPQEGSSNGNDIWNDVRPYPVYLDASIDTPKYENFMHSYYSWTTTRKSTEDDSEPALMNRLAQTLLSRYTSTTTKTRKPITSGPAMPLLLLDLCNCLLVQILPLVFQGKSYNGNSYADILAEIYTNNGGKVASSQSQIYQWRLLEAAMESMLRGYCASSESAVEWSLSVLRSSGDHPGPLEDNTVTSSPPPQQPSSLTAAKNYSYHVPAPFLLLDEWLDRETSVVIQSVQQSLQALIQETGAIVVVVTHYPERWKHAVVPGTATKTTSETTTRRIILSRGKVVVD